MSALQHDRWLRSYIFSFTIIICSSISFIQNASAQTTIDASIDKDYLIALALKDGALSVQASFCKLEADIAPLIEKQMFDARDTAKKYSIDFGFIEWKAHSESSARSAQRLLQQLPRSGENYEKNCAEVKAKVAARLVQKLP
jgi:macrodomain Ter protein organizer (MatP/YcbG family)